MTDERDGGLDRRQTLKCMLWAGTGVVWTVAGGVPSSRLIGSAKAAEGSFSFVQMSDSHIGFEKPANPDARATLDAAIDKVLAMPDKPAFMIHTGDVSHTAKPSEFDDALQLIGRAKLDVHYAPGEHDILDPKTRGRLSRALRQGRDRRRLVCVRSRRRPFRVAQQCRRPQKKRPRLAWRRAARVARRRSQSQVGLRRPIVIFCHIPLWMIAPEWGWGTEDSAQALGYLARFGSVTVLNGHIHQLMQKVEGNVTFHTARSTAFPQPAPGTAPAPGPKLVPAGELRKWLGVREVAYSASPTNLAVTDTDLS